jgi:hypothetical protein
MKQALVYSLKVSLTSSSLAIVITCLYGYLELHQMFDLFGLPYSLMYELFADEWGRIELGFVILWLTMVVLTPILLSKPSVILGLIVTVFLVAEGLTSLWLIVLSLYRKHDYFVPGLFLWLVCSLTLALAVRIFKIAVQMPRISDADQLSSEL